MTDALEAAAEALNAGLYTDGDWDAADVRYTVIEWLRAAIGCPQCKGHNYLYWTWTDHEGQELPAEGECPAEHVEVPFMGDIIHAAPQASRRGMVMPSVPHEEGRIGG